MVASNLVLYIIPTCEGSGVMRICKLAMRVKRCEQDRSGLKSLKLKPLKM